jgi:RNA polymerase sigma factor (sigma-70 family)
VDQEEWLPAGDGCPTIAPMGAPTLSDAKLVARCRGGDDQAWAELVERFSRYVYAICARAFSLPEHAADDVFQEVFARVFERLDELREDAAIRPWIAQTTRRLCIDHLRAGSHAAPDEVAEIGAVDDEMARIEEAVTVRAGLAELSENCQEILDRFFARDESYRLIAEALDIPSGTIASRISRCLVKLRSEIEGTKSVSAPSGG